jgi:L1 cell adhesion molecule like protein
LEQNPQATAEEIEEELKKIEAKYNPIMMRIYQSAGGAPGGMPGGMPGGFPGGMPGGAGAPTGGPTGGVDDLD